MGACSLVDSISICSFDDLEQEQTDYFMDISQYSMLLKMPEARANLTLHKGGKYEPDSKSASS